MDKSRHVFECRSDIAKLTVIQSRVRSMCKELQDLQQFLSMNVSGSTNTHSFLQASLQSTAFMCEGVLVAIQKEQNACIVSLEGKLPTSHPSGRGSTGATRTRFQVYGGWDYESPLTFACGGIEYQVKAPPDTKVGDWVEFNSNTCILTKFDR